ncbi:thymidylate kinase [Bacillus phage G]|uniref:Gp315 n=1 Tax=Bacillus phage G TaxID=2884420 RepID=G3MA56_9CAUD|nr:thymidylate kinase [Bacillus phage G]AEO93574.1 gp315 [Bacillus phage G]
MSIISTTGPDGSGKTTIVKKLSEKLGYPTQHFDKPKDMLDAKNQYFSFVDNLAENESKIADRFHEGEWIYAPKLRGYTADYLREFERKVINKHSFLQVFVKAELETIIKRTRVRGEDFIKEEDFQTFLDLFEEFMDNQAMPFIEIDTTNSKTENDVKRIIEAFEKAKIIWDLVKNGSCSNTVLKPVQPRGNIEGKVMVVAQNPGGRGEGEYSTVWADGNNSKFLLDATKKAGIFRDTWFTNLVPYPTQDNQITKAQIEEVEHIIYAQVELIKPKVIIGLGNIVNEHLNKLFGGNVPIIELKHPAYVKRFLSGDKDYKTKYSLDFAEAKKYL